MGDDRSGSFGSCGNEFGHAVECVAQEPGGDVGIEFGSEVTGGDAVEEDRADLILELDVERCELVAEFGREVVVGHEGVPVAGDRSDMPDELFDGLTRCGDDRQGAAEAVGGVSMVDGGCSARMLEMSG